MVILVIIIITSIQPSSAEESSFGPLGKCADVDSILVIDQLNSPNADSLIAVATRLDYNLTTVNVLPDMLELDSYDVVIDFDGSRLYGESFMSDEVLQEHFDLLYPYAENGGKVINFGDFENDDAQNYEICLPDDDQTSVEFEGLVTELPLSIPADDKVTADVTIQVTGAVTVNSGSTQTPS